MLTGAGKAFSAGGDFGLLQAMVDDTDAPDDDHRRGQDPGASRCWQWRSRSSRAVNGPAVGLGCSLASLCDLVLIAEDAYLSIRTSVLGLVAADGGAISWPYLTGLLKAKEHLFLGSRITAAEAVEAGLATRVSADPLAEAVELAHQLATLPPQSVRETKRLLNAGLRTAVATLHRRRHGRRVAVVRHARVPGEPGPAHAPEVLRHLRRDRRLRPAARRGAGR